jgi:hypothetical protein
MRDAYVYGNEAVHAGALGMIANSTLHSGARKHLAMTRPSVDLHATATIAHTTVLILGAATIDIGYTLFVEFKEWDDVFAMSKLHGITERLRPAFAEAANRYAST